MNKYYICYKQSKDIVCATSNKAEYFIVLQLAMLISLSVMFEAGQV